MAGLVCDICGGKLMSDEEGEIFTCESCGTRFPKEQIMKLFTEIPGTVNIAGGANAVSLVTRARLLCEDGNFTKATELIDQALNTDPENGEAYLVALMAQYGVRQEGDLAGLTAPISGSGNYQKALRFGNAALGRRLEEYSRTVDERSAAIRKAEQERIEAERREAERKANITNSALSTINGATGVEWNALELDETNHKVLVIAKDCVDEGRFDANSNKWADSEIRRWLNGEYLNWLQQTVNGRVLEVKNQTNGNVTTDKVFLLSIDEANKYFADNTVRITKYDGSTTWWWLRSPGRSNGAADVGADGGVGDYGNNVDDGGGGVRPAFWLNLES